MSCRVGNAAGRSRPAGAGRGSTRHRCHAPAVETIANCRRPSAAAVVLAVAAAPAPVDGHSSAADGLRVRPALADDPGRLRRGRRLYRASPTRPSRRDPRPSLSPPVQVLPADALRLFRPGPTLPLLYTWVVHSNSVIFVSEQNNNNNRFTAVVQVNLR